MPPRSAIARTPPRSRSARRGPAPASSAGRAPRAPAPGDDPRRAITTLLDRHGARLHATALRLCGHRSDAEDAVQEAFLEAFRGWHAFEGRSDPATWLTTILLRRCRRRIRSRVRERRFRADADLLPWREDEVSALGAAVESAPHAAERAEALARLREEIPRLPDHLRLPVVLHEIMGLSMADAAAFLRLAPNTVKTRLHRARLALRRTLLRRVATIDAPAPVYEKRVCVDLLKAKMDALDRGDGAIAGRLPPAELCARCRAVFRELDLVHDACARMEEGRIPPSVRRAVMRELQAASADAARRATAPRRGRPPLVR